MSDHLDPLFEKIGLYCFIAFCLAVNVALLCFCAKLVKDLDEKEREKEDKPPTYDQAVQMMEKGNISIIFRE